MRPYMHRKFIEYPDVADIQFEARKSSMGRLKEKGGDYKPYTRKASRRRQNRRYLKRSDKMKMDRDDFYEYDA